MADVASARLTFWGTRGSLPVGGPGTVRHGGATACVTIEEGDRRLILDAGSGIQRLGQSLPATHGRRAHSILLSHMHWDHIAGLPFFPPLYDPAAVVTVIGPDQPSATIQAALAGLMAPAFWPIAPRCAMRVSSITNGEHSSEGFGLLAFPLAHAGQTLGYRITCQSGRTVSYVTDNELAAMHPAQRQALVQAVAGSDVLIHDATWNDDLLPQRAGWGHSSGTEAATLGLDAGCAMVVLFHHDPDADDAALDRQLDAARERVATPGGPRVVAAADGLILDL